MAGTISLSIVDDTAFTVGWSNRQEVDMMDVEKILDVIADFEFVWYSEHDSLYTDEHHSEYRQAKIEYLENYMRAEAEAQAERIEAYENDPVV